MRVFKWVLWSLGGVVGAVVLSVVLLLAYRALRQHQEAHSFAIRTPPGIQEEGFVRIGGIDQFVLIRGDDRRNPVVLMLHGGPGLAQSLLFPWFRPWEKDFTVVQWDQRGAGNTYGRYGDKTPNLTPDQMAQDGIELAEYLRRHLGTDRLILLGHSWGSQLGLRMVAKRPDLFAAYVGTGQVVDDAQAESAGYGVLLSAAQRAGDAKTVATLRSIGPPPYRDSKAMLEEREAAAPYGPKAEEPGAYYARSVPTALFAPGFSLKDFWNASAGGLYSLKVLMPRIGRFDARRVGTSFGVPMFFIQGDRDTLTPTPLVKQYMDEITAPRNELILLREDGHGALLTDPDGFLKAMKEHVRPVVMGGR
jgi:pimeloyl-ACP methyl ester carboxylesterase